jgi:hypothetical protein
VRAKPSRPSSPSRPPWTPLPPSYSPRRPWPPNRLGAVHRPPWAPSIACGPLRAPESRPPRPSPPVTAVRRRRVPPRPSSERQRPLVSMHSSPRPRPAGSAVSLTGIGGAAPPPWPGTQLCDPLSLQGLKCMARAWL